MTLLTGVNKGSGSTTPCSHLHPCIPLVYQQGAALLLPNSQRGGAEVGGEASETHKLIAGKEDGNKSSRKANVENAVLVYV